MSKHTKGPWRYLAGTHSVYAGMKAVALVYGPRKGTDEQQEANAFLITAAPDLLAMLVEAHDIIDAIGQPETAEVAARMQDVIAKAKGEA